MNGDDVAATTARVRRLVSMATGGRIDERDLADNDVDLRRIGLDSLGYLNLLEGLERTFGVMIDLDREADHTFLHTIGNIVRFIRARQGQAA